MPKIGKYQHSSVAGSGGTSSAKPLSNMFDINVKKCSSFVLSLIRLTSRDFALFSASSLLFGISGLSGLNGSGASQFLWLFFTSPASMIVSNCRSSIDFPGLLPFFVLIKRWLSGSQNKASRLLSLT